MAFKASATIHKSPKGALKVLACSEDADEAVNAYVDCKDAGEVQLIIAGRLQKQKKIEAQEKPAKKSKK
jgi:hypothetical protein